MQQAPSLVRQPCILQIVDVMAALSALVGSPRRLVRQPSVVEAVEDEVPDVLSTLVGWLQAS